MLNSAKEIENILLKGDELTWIEPESGKQDKIKLGSTLQRSLLRFLLNSSSRAANDLSEMFITGIKEASKSENDPANTIPDSIELSASKQSWKLQKLESYGFGGINLFEAKEFSCEFDGESICLEGENGSGKSSLISAIQWALTGQIIKDKAEEKSLEIPQNVYNDQGKNIGVWPPIASYPDDIGDFKKQPIVWVKLTFIDKKTSENIVVERRLENGEVTEQLDPRIGMFSGLFEPAILMPSRLPHIDLSGKTTNLVDAIQKLTGLEPLAELGDFVSGQGLGHSNREFLKYAKSQGIGSKKSQFETAIQSAHDAFEEDKYDILQYKIEIESGDLEEKLEILEGILSQSGSEILSILKYELSENFKLDEVRNAVSELGNTLRIHKSLVIPSATMLNEIEEQIDDAARTQLNEKLSEVEILIQEAVKWHIKRDEDRKLKLKLIAAQYHLEIYDDGEVSNCPVCETSLHDQQSLSEELKTLKCVNEIAQKSFDDSIREIRDSLYTTIPQSIRNQFEAYASINPQPDFIQDLNDNLLADSNVENTLIGIKKFLESSLENTQSKLPKLKEPKFVYETFWDQHEQLSELLQVVLKIKRISFLSEWWKDNAKEYHAFLDSIVGIEDPEKKEYPENTVLGKLTKLTDSLEQSKPYEIASNQIVNAIENAKTWKGIKAEQDCRESITEALKPLSKLRKYVEAKSKEALESLSKDMSKIYEIVCSSERFKYQDTKIKKNNVVIQGQLNNNYKLDATLIANTSWLRQVLWSFVFALRNATLKKIGYNPFPLMALDDPQATFDTKHRRKWAEHICDLSKLEDKEIYSTQFFITSHDILFANYLLTLDRFNGNFGYISYASPATKVLVIAGGKNIERKWSKAEQSQSKDDGFDYISYMRIYVETILQIMLHGEAPDVGNMLLSDLRGLLENRKLKEIPPFNRPEFEKLINHTHKAKEPIKLIQETHHLDNAEIGFVQAKDIKNWWDNTFEKIILDAFGVYREYRLINGEPKSLFSISSLIDLPEGHTKTLANKNIEITGKVAALTDGRYSDGCFLIEEGTNKESINFFNHSVYYVVSNTLEPVANYGDIIIVANYEKTNPLHSDLVVVAIEDRLLARRYSPVDGHPELIALVSQAINPKDLKSPHIKNSSSISDSIKRIVGVLYSDNSYVKNSTENEIISIEAESTLNEAIENTFLFEIKGRSAEPYALDGQYLLVGPPKENSTDFEKMDGKFVFAVDSDNNNYFKRLRVFSKGKILALESLDLSGKEESLLFSNDQDIGLPKIQQISSVKGVIFELPQKS
jgi:energy-coupling factor transporter ATP-binding protein EcfA2